VFTWELERPIPDPHGILSFRDAMMVMRKRVIYPFLLVPSYDLYSQLNEIVN
jgi:hypothetical protein